MEVFARDPVGRAESRNLVSDLALLTFEAFGFGFVGGELFEVGPHQRGDGGIPFGGRNSGASVRFVVNGDCDIAHVIHSITGISPKTLRSRKRASRGQGRVLLRPLD